MKGRSESWVIFSVCRRPFNVGDGSRYFLKLDTSKVSYRPSWLHDERIAKNDPFRLTLSGKADVDS